MQSRVERLIIFILKHSFLLLFRKGGTGWVHFFNKEIFLELIPRSLFKFKSVVISLVKVI